MANPTAETAAATSTRSAEPAVAVEHVYKIFGPRPGEALRRLRDGESRSDVAKWGTAAVIDASFEVSPGEIFVVMGLSGSGKSTLIRTLNGLWKPTAGSVKVSGVDVAEADPRTLRRVRRSHISMVFQHFALLPHRTVLQNAAYGLEIQGMAKKEREEHARKTLQLVGLGEWADRLPSELSGGMQQRVGLARALAADTDVLLMDEAFSALDPLIRREMQDQLLDLQQQLGKTIIFITHDLNEAMRLGDRIAVMRNGRIAQIGTSEEILSDPANDYVAQFVADVDKTRVLTAAAVQVRPAAEVLGTHGPAQARRIMSDSQTAAAYVVDRSRRLLGYVRDDEVVGAQRDGVPELTSLIHPEAFAVRADTLLSEIFAPAAESRLPVAVVDDAGRLTGVIPRAVLLAAMVPSEAPPTGPIALPSLRADADAGMPPAVPEPRRAAASGDDVNSPAQGESK